MWYFNKLHDTTMHFYLPSIVSGYCRKTSGSTTNRVSSTTSVNLSVMRKLAAMLLPTAPTADPATSQHQSILWVINMASDNDT